MDKLSAPVEFAYRQYESEKIPFIKLYRLVDTFETILKYASVIAIQNFYTAKLDGKFQKVDRNISKDLDRPSLGQWYGFLRDSLKCFGNQREDLFCEDLYLFLFVSFGGKQRPNEQVKNAIERLLSLRNNHAHGATSSDIEATAEIIEYEPQLRCLMSATQFLSSFQLVYREETNSTKQDTYLHFVGDEIRKFLPSQQLEGVFSSGHLHVVNPVSDVVLDLHPLMVYMDCEQNVLVLDMSRKKIEGKQKCGQRKIFFYDSIDDKDRIVYLDYWRAHHSQFSTPNQLSASYRSSYPKTTRHPGVFDAFELAQTRYFVGRKEELDALDSFLGDEQFQALVLSGPPGIGKTAILAKWSEQHDVSIVRHYIREGDVATWEMTSVFNSLAQQIADKYLVKCSKPSVNDARECRGAFLQTLGDAAKSIKSTIVVLIDGIDEAERAAISNNKTATLSVAEWLPETQSLPSNIKIVLSCRPETLLNPSFIAKYGVDKAKRLALSPLDSGDIRQLLFNVCSKYDVLSSSDYVEAIVQRSEGSPIYLRMLINDIADGRLALGQTDDLPRGIIAFYDRILNTIAQHEILIHNKDLEQKAVLLSHILDGTVSVDSVRKLQESAIKESGSMARNTPMCVLVILCMVFEPITIEEVSDILSVDLETIYRAYEVIKGVLSETSPGKYAVFHAAFRSYVLDVGSYAPNGKQWNVESVDYARKCTLDYCDKWKSHNSEYVRHNYTRHLVEWGLFDRLDELVSGTESRVWADWHFSKDYHFATYIADIDRAWDMASRLEASVSFQHFLCYTVIKSNIHSIVDEFHYQLLPKLVELGYLDVPHALSFSGLDQKHLASTLAHLLDYLVNSPVLVEFALSLALQNKNEDLLTRIICLLNEDQLDTIDENPFLIQTNKQKKFILDRRQEIWDIQNYESTDQGDINQDAGLFISDIGFLFDLDELSRLTAISKYAPLFCTDTSLAALTYVIDHSKYDHSVISAIKSLAPHMESNGLSLAIDYLTSHYDQNGVVDVVAYLIPFVQDIKIRASALDIIALSKDGYRVLREIAPSLRRPEIEYVLQTSRGYWHHYDRCSAWIECAQYLSKDFLRIGFLVVTRYEEQDIQLGFIESLTPLLPDDMLPELLDYLAKVRSQYRDDTVASAHYIHTVVSLLPRLHKTLREHHLSDLPEVVFMVPDGRARAIAIAPLLKHMPLHIAMDIIMYSCAAFWAKHEEPKPVSVVVHDLLDLDLNFPEPDPQQNMLPSQLGDWESHRIVSFNEPAIIDFALDILPNIEDTQVRWFLCNTIVWAIDNEREVSDSNLDDYGVDYAVFPRVWKKQAAEKLVANLEGDIRDEIEKWLVKNGLIERNYGLFPRSFINDLFNNALSSKSGSQMAKVVPFLTVEQLRTALLSVRDREDVISYTTRTTSPENAQWADDGEFYETVEHLEYAAYKRETEFWETLLPLIDKDLLGRIVKALTGVGSALTRLRWDMGTFDYKNNSVLHSVNSALKNNESELKYLITKEINADNLRNAIEHAKRYGRDDRADALYAIALVAAQNGFFNEVVIAAKESRYTNALINSLLLLPTKTLRTKWPMICDVALKQKNEFDASLFVLAKVFPFIPETHRLYLINHYRENYSDENIAKALLVLSETQYPPRRNELVDEAFEHLSTSDISHWFSLNKTNDLVNYVFCSRPFVSKQSLERFVLGQLSLISHLTRQELDNALTPLCCISTGLGYNDFETVINEKLFELGKLWP